MKNQQPKFYTEIEYYKYVIETQQKQIELLTNMLKNK